MFKLFIEGVEEGIKSVFKLIPIIIAFFLFSGILISSNIINIMFENVFKLEENLKYVFIVSIIKMFSGSAGISMGLEVLKKVGVDSVYGIALSVILGSTETVFYVVSIYLNRFKSKKIFPICILGVLCNLLVLFISLNFIIDF